MRHVAIATARNRAASFRHVLGSVREVDGRGLAVLAGLELVAELLAFPERAKARPLDRGDVDEGVGATRFVGDEAVAPVGIEEFYGAAGHDLVRSENETARAQKAMPAHSALDFP